MKEVYPMQGATPHGGGFSSVHGNRYGRFLTGFTLATILTPLPAGRRGGKELDFVQNCTKSCRTGGLIAERRLQLGRVAWRRL